MMTTNMHLSSSFQNPQGDGSDSPLPFRANDGEVGNNEPPLHDFLFALFLKACCLVFLISSVVLIFGLVYQPDVEPNVLAIPALVVVGVFLMIGAMYKLANASISACLHCTGERLTGAVVKVTPETSSKGSDAFSKIRVAYKVGDRAYFKTFEAQSSPTSKNFPLIVSRNNSKVAYTYDGCCFPFKFLGRLLFSVLLLCSGIGATAVGPVIILMDLLGYTSEDEDVIMNKYVLPAIVILVLLATAAAVYEIRGETNAVVELNEEVACMVVPSSAETCPITSQRAQVFEHDATGDHPYSAQRTVNKTSADQYQVNVSGLPEEIPFAKKEGTPLPESNV